MRVTRPLALAAALCLGLTLSGPAPYAAADTTVVVHGLGDLPTDGSAGLFFVSCSAPWTGSGTLDPGPLHIQEGPAPVPIGTRTWGFDMPAPSAGYAIGPFRSVSSMATLSTAQADFYDEGAGTANGVAFAGVDPADLAGDYWMGVAPLMLPAGSWQTVTAGDKSYSWTQINSQFQPTGQTYSGTISQLLTNKIGTGDHDGYVGAGFGCNTPGLVDFDKAQIGDTGDVTTYDYEAALTTTTITGKPSTVTAGQSVTLKGVTTDSTGGSFSSAQLTLQAKTFGSSTWQDVGQATETNDGTQTPATLKKKPLVETKYRWEFPESPSSLGSVSPTFTVKVHTAVSAKAADTTVSKGGTIKITGRTTPAKPGQTVHLMKGSAKVGSGIVKADGTFTIKAKAASTGTWKLRVTIGASTGNLAGRSKTVKVTVG
jgi:hypothetical protein